MPDWISKTLGRVLRSREWTNSSSDTAMALSWLVCRSDFYRNLWLLDVNCLQSLSLLIISPSSRQNVKGEPNQGKTALGGQVLVRSGYSSHFLPGAKRMSHCSQAQEEQLKQGKAENRQEAEWVKPLFFLRLHFLLTLKQVWGWGVFVWTVATQSNEVGKLPMPVHPQWWLDCEDTGTCGVITAHGQQARAVSYLKGGMTSVHYLSASGV